MGINVNCKYFDGFVKCKHPALNNRWYHRIFRKACIYFEGHLACRHQEYRHQRPGTPPPNVPVKDF